MSLAQAALRKVSSCSAEASGALEMSLVRSRTALTTAPTAAVMAATHKMRSRPVTKETRTAEAIT